MDEIYELQKSVLEAQKKFDSGLVTLNRGRLIKKIKVEIRKIKNNVDGENKEKLLLLEGLLKENLDSHKRQLIGRYKVEFVKNGKGVKNLFISIPSAIKTSVMRISACMESMKIAKTNKEKIFETIDMFKSIGLFFTVPVVFTSKFLVKSWYLGLLFAMYVFDLPGYVFENTKENILFGGSLFEDIKSTLASPDELEKIRGTGIDRIKCLPDTIKNDFEAFRDFWNFVGSKKEYISDVLDNSIINGKSR